MDRLRLSFSQLEIILRGKRGDGPMVVYADVVILLNFLVDSLLLLGTNKLTGHLYGMGRTLLGGLAGALYSGLCLFPSLRFLNGVLWKIASLFGISLISFGWNHSTFQRTITFILLSTSLGGLALGIGNGSFLTTVGCCIFLYLAIRFGFINLTYKKYVTVELEYRGKRKKLKAFCDTGNFLSDPLTGEAVLVAGADVANELLCISCSQLKDPIGAITTLGITGLRLVPYRVVGKSSGMLLAARMDKVSVNGKRIGSLVAFAPEDIGNGDFQALIGGIV